MATKTPAANKTASPAATPAAPKKPRVPGMTRAQKFDLMLFVRAAAPEAPDGAVAKSASEKFSRPVSSLTIASYRKDLGLQSVPAHTKAALLARVADLESMLAKANEQIEEMTNREPA